MTTYELETGTIGFREIPNDGNIFNTGINARNPIPDGFELLGIFSELKEEDVKEVMPRRNAIYFDYVGNRYNPTFKYAKESIHSLAQHLGLDAVNPIDNVKCGCCGLNGNCKVCNEWQEAQSKVKQYFVVFKTKAKE
jgi:hypothetical protein